MITMSEPEILFKSLRPLLMVSPYSARTFRLIETRRSLSRQLRITASGLSSFRISRAKPESHRRETRAPGSRSK
ncbi:MAG: hypothetical protein A2W19_01665 [Spirochaetes bacterium RBG_16_49_21]|nr:MAG: hypothetical protein A2W19_01665 [Spirochaetes bacterium RBG_16_49_21]